MADKITLTGITWDHSRGYTPLIAASQRFGELYPQVEICWKKRSLQEFADEPLEKLAGHYDLLVIDHPWVGRAAATGSVLALDEWLAPGFLDDQRMNSAGGAHETYHYAGQQWALAIDAAAPVASYRADLLQQHDTVPPTDWKGLIDLARKGKVAIPAIPIDLLMNFYMFCLAEGCEPFLREEELIDRITGLKVLDTMKTLWSLTDRKMFVCNPITVAELMTSTDDYWYCPFAYGYSNYARNGYARHVLHYTDLVSYGHTGLLRSTIGGTGLAVSAIHTVNAAGASKRKWALEFLAWVASAEIQAGLYLEAGGQPAHRSAWTNKEVNRNCHDFFRNTLHVLERGYRRPRYNGYLYFQDHAGLSLQEYLKDPLGRSPGKLLEKMNELYRTSKRTEKKT